MDEGDEESICPSTWEAYGRGRMGVPAARAASARLVGKMMGPPKDAEEPRTAGGHPALLSHKGVHHLLATPPGEG